MWKLIMRGARGTPFVEAGSYASLHDAAEAIRKTEGDPIGVMFLQIYLDPMGEPSDAEALSHLTYQGKGRYYEVTRNAN
jgi:hypothetical protein